VENKSPIGIFDSGYGGLTVFSEIQKLLPEYDFKYLGDNARAPYGDRSFEAVYEYTWEAVNWLLSSGCPLVIIACNTASAKALRSIQQNELLQYFPDRKVLGIIRPTAEIIGSISHSGHIGILATNGTVNSGSYLTEIGNFYPDLTVHQQACPLWVPFIENFLKNESSLEEIVRQDLQELFSADADIDTILLACTHYPLIFDLLRNLLPPEIQIISQGEIIAGSLQDYLYRHPEIQTLLSIGAQTHFHTTDDPIEFERHATFFFGKPVRASKIHL